MIRSKAEWFVAVRAQDADSVLRSVHKYIGSKNGLGDTALITAVRARDVQMSTLLLPFEHALLDARGYPALAIAIEMDAPELVCLLAPLEKEVKIPGYSSPLALAATCGAFRSLRILTTLIEDIPTGEHESALQQVARAHHFSMAETLLETQAYTCKDLTDAAVLCEGTSHSAVELKQILNLAIKFSASGSALNLHTTLKTLQAFMDENAFLIRFIQKILRALKRAYTTLNSKGFSAASCVPSSDGVDCTLWPKFLQSRTSSMDVPSSNSERFLAMSLGASSIASKDIVSKAVAHQYLETDDGKRLLMEVSNMQALIAAQKDTLMSMKNTVEVILTAFYSLPGCSIPPCEGDNHLTPLMKTVIDNDMEKLLQLVLAYSGKKTDEGETALMIAARHNSLIAIKILCALEYGARDSKGKTALRHALEARNSDSVAVLIETDQEQYSESLRETGWKCTEGKTCLSIALEQNMAFTYRYLISHEAMLCIDRIETKEFGLIESASPLMLAVSKGRLEAVILLAPLAAGYTDPINKRSALMLAACIGNSTAARILAPYEAGLQDFQGYTALMYAAECNYVDIVELLLLQESKMVTGARSGWGSGRTALMLAAYNGCVETVAHLIPYEAGIVQAGSETGSQHAGWSALVWAASSPEASLACIEMLVEKESEHAKKALEEVPYWREDRSDIKRIFAPYIEPLRPTSQKLQSKQHKNVL